MYKSQTQGILDLGDAPPPSLLEDPDIELGDLATVAYVERPAPTVTGATLIGWARRVHQHEAQRHFAAGGSIIVSESGHELELPVWTTTTTHNATTTTWADLVGEVRMWRGRYPNQRFYIVA